jgi:hypothetical protein
MFEFNHKKWIKVIFFILTSITIVRSLIHIFSADGGASSIAGIPLDLFTYEASQAVIFMFAMWGISQLIIGLLYLYALFIKPNLIPLMFLSLTLEYALRLIVGQFKPILTIHTAPGAYANYIAIPLSLILFALSIKKTTSKVV